MPRAQASPMLPARRTFSRPRLIVCALLVAAVALGLAASAEHALAQSATPTLMADDVAPGGRLRVRGYAFPPNQQLTLQLRGGGEVTALGGATADRSGVLPPVSFTLSRAVTPANYNLEALTGPTVLATTVVTVRAPLQLTLNPGGGPPGTRVNVTVNNLVPGTLRIDYGGGAVLGPITVRASQYVGAFDVPRGRPIPPGPVEVLAVNLVGGRAVGEAAATFQAQAPPPEPAYQVTQLAIAGAGQAGAAQATAVEPGQVVRVQGQISPAPAGPLEDFTLTPFWEKPDGRRVPIAVGPVTLSPNGAFAGSVHIPSFFEGDPVYAAPADRLGIQFSYQKFDGSEGTLIHTITPVVSQYLFRFQVLRDTPGQPGNGEPVLNLPAPPAGAPDPLYLRIEPLVVMSTTMAALYAGTELKDTIDAGAILGPLREQQVYAASKGLLDCTYIAAINAEADFKSWLWGVNPWEAAIYSAGDPPISAVRLTSAAGAAGAAEAAATAATAAANEDEVLMVLMRLYVDASRVNDYSVQSNSGSQTGYGAVQTVNGVNYVKPYDQLFVFIPKLQRAYLVDEATSTAAESVYPVQVKLPKLPANVENSTQIKSVEIAGIKPGKVSTGLSGVEYQYSGLYSFKDAPAGIQYTGGSLAVRTEIALVKQVVDQFTTEVVMLLNGTTPLTVKASGDGACGKKDQTRWYEAVVPNAHLLGPGLHSISVYVAGNSELHKAFLIYNLKHPAWLEDPKVTNKRVTWSPGGVTITADAFDPSKARIDLNKNIDYAGNVKNNTRIGGQLVQQLVAGQPPGGAPQIVGGMESDSMNNCGRSLDYGSSAATGPGEDKCAPPGVAAASAAQPFTSAAPAAADATTFTILDTGKIRIFEIGYGIPKIAWLYIGVDFRISAEGSVVAATDTFAQTVTSDVTVTVVAEVEVLITAGAELLAGIAEANFSFGAGFGVAMPTTYRLGQTPSPQEECIFYRLKVYWEVELLWGLFSVAEGSKTLFDDATKDPCPPTASAASARQLPDAPGAALFASPAIATDGFGNTLAVWRSVAGNVLYSRFDGAQWSAVQPVVANGKSGSPAIAFYGPNQAVAVWTESGLSQLPNPGPTTPEDWTRLLLKNQRLAYAVWNGSAWSAPQPLTQVGTGDGRVALAGCMSTDADCPAGGAVTAVWVRDAAGDLAQRKFRIFSATFAGSGIGVNGPWGPSAAVDANEGVTDTEPAVAYRQGVPVVAWVRDLARKVDPQPVRAADRRLAVRLLDGSSPVTLVNGTAGAADPDLLVDAAGNVQLAFTVAADADGIVSNRRALHRAQGACAASCTWSAQKVLDAQGRTIFAESPRLTQGAGDSLTLTFRAMGFDSVAVPAAAVAGLAAKEPVGIFKGTGELAQAVLPPALAAPLGAIDYLSNDGAVHINPAAVYDPVLDAHLALAVLGDAPVLAAHEQSLVAELPARGERIAPTEAVLAVSGPRLPNFVLRDLGAPQPNAGGGGTITLQVANAGPAWNGSGGPLQVVAGWVGGGGETSPAGAAQVPALDAGAYASLTIDLGAPPAAASMLQVVVNPLQTVAEQTLRDNRGTAAWPALAPPSRVQATVVDGQRLVFLEWPASPDARVAGYRVYRLDGAGKATPAGSTFENGWVDANVDYGQEVRYIVTSFDEALNESASGAPITARAGAPLQIVTTGTSLFLPVIQR